MSSIIVYDLLTKQLKGAAMLYSLESQYFVGPLIYEGYKPILRLYYVFLLRTM